ncbi:MAG: efflux RND transporter periplasmic adaptor subunit, partial [Firmicutes bacterium]|nr:efflux RND transporter periplasmic adaptor subunit [Bacillota bacterium]
MRKTKFRRYIYIAAAALLLLGGCSGAKKQEIALLDPVGVQLDTEKVRVRDIVVSDQYTASVRAVSERVYFRAGGRLKDIYVRTGQSVKKGDLLAELDTEDARRDIDDAEKALESLERSYEHANSQARFDIELENFRLDKMRLTPETSAADLRAEEIRAEMLSLDLRHAVERQDAELEWRRSLLDDKRARLGEASLAARTDGVITYVSAIMPGDAVPPFTDIVRLADGDPASLLVICDSAAGSPPYGDNKTTAVIGGREYELEYVQPTMKEML